MSAPECSCCGHVAEQPDLPCDACREDAEALDASLDPAGGDDGWD